MVMVQPRSTRAKMRTIVPQIWSKFCPCVTLPKLLRKAPDATTRPMLTTNFFSENDMVSKYEVAHREENDKCCGRNTTHTVNSTTPISLFRKRSADEIIRKQSEVTQQIIKFPRLVPEVEHNRIHHNDSAAPFTRKHLREQLLQQIESKRRESRSMHQSSRTHNSTEFLCSETCSAGSRLSVAQG